MQLGQRQKKQGFSMDSGAFLPKLQPHLQLDEGKLRPRMQLEQKIK
jgi:hypothetical protein